MPRVSQLLGSTGRVPTRATGFITPCCPVSLNLRSMTAPYITPKAKLGWENSVSLAPEVEPRKQGPEVKQGGCGHRHIPKWAEAPRFGWAQRKILEAIGKRARTCLSLVPWVFWASVLGTFFF